MYRKIFLHVRSIPFGGNFICLYTEEKKPLIKEQSKTIIIKIEYPILPAENFAKIINKDNFQINILFILNYANNDLLMLKQGKIMSICSTTIKKWTKLIAQLAN